MENELLGYFWSKQKEVALSVVGNRRTAVRSCHGTGKTYEAAALAAWWGSVWPQGDARVVTLGPTGAQLAGQMWAELNTMHARFRLPGRTTKTEWWMGEWQAGVGRSPQDTDGTALQGYHAARVLVIAEEACGLSETLVEAAESLMSNEDCRLLMIGNPDDPNTAFAAACKPGSGYNVIHIPASSTPNFTGEDVPPWLAKLLVSKVWVAERLKKLGESSPVYKSKVLAEFPEQSTDSMVPITKVQAALERGKAKTGPLPAGGDLGVDVARFGGDAVAIVYRSGDDFQLVDRDRKRDLMHVAGMVVRAIEKYRPLRCKVDVIGMGGGPVDRLREMQREEGCSEALRVCSIVGVDVGKPAMEDHPLDGDAVVRTDEKTGKRKPMYKLVRSQLNWHMRDRFVEDRINILPPDMPEGREADNDDLASQAAQIKYEYTSDGLLKVEAKEVTKARLKGRSPDDWDALVLAGAEGVADEEMDVWRKLGA